MEYDTKTPPYNTSDKNSFAYISAKDRWPVIITGAIDDVHKAIHRTDNAEAQQEGKRIVEQIAKLKYELQHNRVLTPIEDDGQPDVEGYNKELQALGPPSWFNVPWLYSECYLYRRLSTFFTLSKHWKNYDVFSAQKMSTFRSSRPAVLELAARYHEISNTASHSNDPEAEKILFTEMCEICLWGNATDLSLLTSLSYEDIQKLQGAKARKESEANVLVNDLPAAYEVLAAAKKAGQERRVDIVLDNAGFELFVDLILAGYLLSAGLATTVVLHPKSIPWFVSDVLPKDFADLLNIMSDPQAFYSSTSESDIQAGRKPEPLKEQEIKEVAFLFDQWSNFHAEGQLVIRPNRFWTQAGSYWRLPATANRLHEDLQEAELVIFKGDLNYRKLVGDAAWDPSTPFSEAIGPLGKGSGVRTLALRTCKADTVVGLEKGVDEKLRKQQGGDEEKRKWAWSGKWAVVEFCDGKK